MYTTLQQVPHRQSGPIPLPYSAKLSASYRTAKADAACRRRYHREVQDSVLVCRPGICAGDAQLMARVHSTWICTSGGRGAPQLCVWLAVIDLEPIGACQRCNLCQTPSEDLRLATVSMASEATKSKGAHLAAGRGSAPGIALRDALQAQHDVVSQK